MSNLAQFMLGNVSENSGVNIGNNHLLILLQIRNKLGRINVIM